MSDRIGTPREAPSSVLSVTGQTQRPPLGITHQRLSRLGHIGTIQLSVGVQIDLRPVSTGMCVESIVCARIFPMALRIR